MPGVRESVTAAVAGAARRLVDELEGDGGMDAAIAAARDLSAAADTALQVAVDRARSAGQTWRDIGLVLGTSRQAAFQKFGHPVDPRTGQVMDRTPEPAARRRVTEFLAWFLNGQWEDVREALDDTLQPRLSTDRLAAGWASMAARFGRFERMGPVAPIRIGASTEVDVELTFEAGETMLWVCFDHNGRVTGLRLHPSAR